MWRNGNHFKVQSLFSASPVFVLCPLIWQLCSMYLNLMKNLLYFCPHINFLPFPSSLECHEHADFVIKEFFDF